MKYKPNKGLVERFTKKQAELAAKISNDIAEDIDCNETRAQLRMAVAYWADVACVNGIKVGTAESKLRFAKVAQAYLKVALK